MRANDANMLHQFRVFVEGFDVRYDRSRSPTRLRTGEGMPVGIVRAGTIDQRVARSNAR